MEFWDRCASCLQRDSSPGGRACGNIASIHPSSSRQDVDLVRRNLQWLFSWIVLNYTSYKPWSMGCKERAADPRDHIYLERCGIVKKSMHDQVNKSLDAAEESGAQALLVTGAFGFVLGKAATWHMSTLKFAFCNIPLLLLKHSAFQPFQSWPTNLSSSTSRHLKYQGDGRFFCNGMDLQLLGRQRLHCWNVSLAHRGRQLGNLLPRYITANASQSTQIQTDAEKLMRRHMPRSTCQVSMCSCI